MFPSPVIDFCAGHPIFHYVFVFISIWHRQNYIIIPHPTQIPSHYPICIYLDLSSDEIEFFVFYSLCICMYLDLRHLYLCDPLNICIYLAGICSTDEIEWNRNGDGVIDFYPLHFLFPASKFSICIFVFTFTPFTSSSLQVGFSSLKGTTSNSHKKKEKN